MTRFKWIAALATLFLVLGALPVLAEEGEPEDPEGIEEPTEEDEGLLNSPLAVLLATEYGITLEEIAALGEAGLGFGEIFKLKTLSLLTGLTFDELLAGFEVDPETGEYEFDWGAFKQSLTEEQLAFLDTLPKNFGQFVSAHKRHHGRDEHQPDHAALKLQNNKNH
jgi:hypothetical protein